MCGDGILTANEECDDGNGVAEDGCFLCLVEYGYACSGQPSLCLYILPFSIKFKSIAVSTMVCNQFTISFYILPIDPAFS